MIVDDLLAEVLRRPRRYVEELSCHGHAPCGDCWWCIEGSRRGRYVVATGRFTDITRGTMHAMTITETARYPVREEEFAGPWLRRCFDLGRRRSGMGAKRVPWQKVALGHLSTLPPRYFAGGRQVGEWAYVDLVQAYPSIYSRHSLDCVFRPHPDSPQLGFGGMSMECEPDLLEAKTMHRAVGGILRSTVLNEVINGRAIQRETVSWSRFLAPDLWGFIQWTLHAIARMAIDEFGAVMWDTDGGVVPAEQMFGLLAAISDRWHLAARVEHQGTGTVYGVKHWKIGADETKQGGRRRALTAEDRVMRPAPAIVECLRGAL